MGENVVADMKTIADVLMQATIQRDIAQAVSQSLIFHSNLLIHINFNTWP